MKLLNALDAGNLLLKNLLDPVSAQDAATRNYVDVTAGVSAATASALVRRSASSRAQFADPSAAQDAATKNYVDATAGTSAATASALVRRDGSSRAQFADPSAAQDAATKNYVDLQSSLVTKTYVDTADSLRLKYRGAWSSGNAYLVNDAVLNTNKLYIATKTAPYAVGAVSGSLTGAASVNLTLPAGSAAGDVVILLSLSQTGYPDPVAGAFSLKGSGGAGGGGIWWAVYLHALSAAEITAGYVTFTQSTNVGDIALDGQVLRGASSSTPSIFSSTSANTTTGWFSGAVGLLVQGYVASGVGAASQASLTGVSSISSASSTAATGVDWYPGSTTPPARTWSFTGTPTGQSTITVLVGAGSTFPASSFTEIGVLSAAVVQAANNLSDLADAATARANLGVTTATAATASTVVLRDSQGRAQFVDPFAAQDAATKNYVDGRPSGLTRSVQNWTASGTFGAAARTDYVAIVTQTGITVTMPDATGNTNRYTIKNVSTDTVTIASTSGQPIDGTVPPITLNSWQSIDLIALGGAWYVI